MRILVIDDEEMIRTLAIKVLNTAGHTVLTAESGLAGIELLERNPHMIDLAIVDNAMPGMTGFETIRGLQRLAPGLPCILSSGNQFGFNQIPDDLRICTSVLHKPYRPKELVEKVLDVFRSASSGD